MTVNETRDVLEAHVLAPKPGVKTSEFWVVVVPTVATMIVALLSAFHVHIDLSATTNALLIVGPAVGAVYAAARTWLKTVRIKNATVLVQATTPTPIYSLPPAYTLGTKPVTFTQGEPPSGT